MQTKSHTLTQKHVEKKPPIRDKQEMSIFGGEMDTVLDWKELLYDNEQIKNYVPITLN